MKLNSKSPAGTTDDKSTNVDGEIRLPKLHKTNVVRRFFSKIFCRHNVEKHIYTCFQDRYVETVCTNCGKHIFRDI